MYNFKLLISFIYFTIRCYYGQSINLCSFQLLCKKQKPSFLWNIRSNTCFTKFITGAIRIEMNCSTSFCSSVKIFKQINTYEQISIAMNTFSSNYLSNTLLDQITSRNCNIFTFELSDQIDYRVMFQVPIIKCEFLGIRFISEYKCFWYLAMWFNCFEINTVINKWDSINCNEKIQQL